MNFKFYHKGLWSLVFLLILFSQKAVQAQRGRTHWAADGYQYYRAQAGQIVEPDTRDSAKKTVLVTKEMLTPPGERALEVENFSLSDDGAKVLLFTNSKRVWRYNTRGDYWVYDLNAKTLKQLGKNRPASSLMFAKLSPDGTKAGYVSEHNIFVEDLTTGIEKQLTFDGTIKLINGTFDWAYEEEFDARDGFRWSPDSKAIAYWQIDAGKIKNYFMLNTTDSIYPFVVPVEYPVAGEDPSSCKVGVVDIITAKTTWMNIPGDAVQHYIPRMEWAKTSNQVILQQLNRAQNNSKIFLANTADGTATLVHEEQANAWIDAGDGRDPIGWNWVNKGKDFIWASEKDGWRHLYKISADGKETLITKGNYDVIDFSLIDEAGGYIYFIASPDNATQKYLYRIKIKGGKAERVTPADEQGTNGYEISPNGKIALHTFSNIYTPGQAEVISLPDHKHISGKVIKLNLAAKNRPEFFKVKTVDGVEMDGWMVKPTNFDPAKKYPVVFYVYSEPAGATVSDAYGASRNGEYVGNMADDGYIYVSLDNRGTPAPKGAAWRKAIYKNIGLVNIEDQAMGAKEVLKWPFVDSTRVAVWGWSGGGSCTLNLMFQHPEIYKTGIAVAAVGWQLSYDNIYQERYMGVPIDDASRAVFIKGSPVTYAKNLRGNLLYVHGTGDDNVHYRNAELLINELVKYNRQFQLMSFPNRTHGIFEGPGTSLYLQTLYTNYLKEHCPPGGR
ncbi:MAG TPA: S9 family peptidase [Mucilaginibacter sp.]|jgi:dipeptidyl-peptidase-4|nr:S9 family peptidase [Mucilaginibacter sp.]